MNILVFDVDGVIIDSTDECLVIAWNAYQEFLGLNDKIYNPSQVSDKYKNKFKSIRNYIRSMDEYLVVFQGEYSNKPTQLDFDSSLISLNKKEKNKFGQIFYNERKKYKEKDLNSWINLHKTYDDVLTLLSIFSESGTLYFITGKDKESVNDLILNYGLNIKIKNIYDKSTVGNKLKRLELISNIEDVNNSEITFVDDNVTHLLDPYNNGFNVFLANWGYAMPDHIKIAKDNGISILNLQDLELMLEV